VAMKMTEKIGKQTEVQKNFFEFILDSTAFVIRVG